MESLSLEYERTGRMVAGELFFPVHLTDWELKTLVKAAFGELIAGSESNMRVSVRKDRGGKGIDLRLEQTYKRPHQVMRERMHTFGLNANWRAADYFEHYTHANGESKFVAGKEYFYPQLVAQEYLSVETPELGGIFRLRERDAIKPVRNPIFDHWDWTCVYEHVHHLNT